MQDHFKRCLQEQEEANKPKEEDNTPKIDLSLKEGQTIKVNLNLGKKSATKPKSKGNQSNTMGILLPPPPSSSSTTIKQQQQTITNDEFNDSLNNLNILSFDSPNKPTKNDVLDDFDDLKLTTSSSNDDWSGFESYKSSDQASTNWATFF